LGGHFLLSLITGKLWRAAARPSLPLTTILELHSRSKAKPE
jgi:hypothetical protein